jgi:hypothetical protein
VSPRSRGYAYGQIPVAAMRAARPRRARRGCFASANPDERVLGGVGWPRELRRRVRDQPKLATGQIGVVSSARDYLAGLIACRFIGTDRRVWYEMSSIGTPSGQYREDVRLAERERT